MPVPETNELEGDNSADSDSDSDSDLEMVAEECSPTTKYRIVFPAHGGPLQIEVQHSDIQDGPIQATTGIGHLKRKIVSEEAFPDARMRGKGVCIAMVETVGGISPQGNLYSALLTRLITDGKFIHSPSTLIDLHKVAFLSSLICNLYTYIFIGRIKHGYSERNGYQSEIRTYSPNLDSKSPQ